MPTLNGSWQEVASQTINIGSGTQTVRLLAYSEENIAGNYSIVHLLFRISVTGSGNYVSVSSWSLAMDGLTGGASGGSTTWSTGDHDIAQGAEQIDHNPDGTGSDTLDLAFGATYGITSWNPSVACTLPTIPRASQPTLNTSSVECNNSNAFTIYTNRASTSFTHSIKYVFINHSGDFATDVGDSTTWTPSTDLLQDIPNATSGSGTIYCKTYSGSTQIGEEKSVGFTLTCNDAKPTATISSVAESGSGIPTSAGYTVIGKSKKTVTAAVRTLYRATVSKVVLTNGNETYTMSLSNGSYVATVPVATSGKYVVTVTDSRGLTSSATAEQTAYPYFQPYIESSSFTRVSPTGSTGNIDIAGKWFYNDSLTNSLTIGTVTVAGSDSSTHTITGTFTPGTGSWSFKATPTELTFLDYKESFTVTFTLTDTFGSVLTVTASLASAEYVLALGKKTVKVKGTLMLNGNNIENDMVPVGCIVMTDSESLFDGNSKWRYIGYATINYAVAQSSGSPVYSSFTGYYFKKIS